LAENLVEVAEDSESLQQHIKAMKDEMSKLKPQNSLLGPLMQSTYKIVKISFYMTTIEQEMGLILNNAILKAHLWTSGY